MDHGASSYRRYLDGDESAFDEIVKELFDPLVFFIDQYVHDVYAAEDIAIDVFADVVAHPKRYHFKVTLKTYLFMLGKSRALNYIKHRKTLRESAIDDAFPLPDEGNTPETLFLQDERSRTVHAALDQLSDDMRMAVHLVFFEQLSYEETARVMKKNKKQVDNLLYRAKKELRAMLGEEELWK